MSLRRINSNVIITGFIVLNLLLLTTSYKVQGHQEIFLFLRYSIIITLVVGFWSFASLTLKKIKIKVDAIHLILASMTFLYVAIAIGCSGANFPDKWGLRNILFTHFFIWSVILLSNNNSEALKNLVNGLKASGLISIIVAFLLPFAQYNPINILNYDIWTNRLHGAFGEPTHFGLFIGFVSLIVSFELTHDKRIRLWKVCFLIALLTALVMSLSKNAIICYIVSLLFLLVSRSGSAVFKSIYLGVGFFCLVSTLSYSELMRNSSVSVNERISSFLNLFDLVSGKPLYFLFGSIQFEEGISTSFNQYFDILAFFGFPTFCLFLFLLISMWNKTHRAISKFNAKGQNFNKVALVYCLLSFLFYSSLFKFFHVISFVFFSLFYLNLIQYSIRSSGFEK